jgi:lysophospholipase L1-like esterase
VTATINLNRRGKVVGALVLAALGAWLVRSWFERYDYVNFPPSASGPWVALGDSLTEGFGASAGHDYPSVLGQRLGISIVNQGKSGDTTADGLARLEGVLQLNPRVVLLCLGGNDGLQRLSRERMLANLGTIIDRLHQNGSFVVVVGVRSATLRDQNRKLFRQLAREKQVFHVPNIMEGVFAKPIHMSDALHPNDEGYRIIDERLAKQLQPLLPELKTP